MDVFEDYLFELRFKPYSKVLDKRGEIAQSLSGELLNQWNIKTNTIDFASEKDPDVSAFFSYQNLGARSVSPRSKKDFIEVATELLKKSWTHFPTNEILRIGVRSRYLKPVKDFTSVFDKYRTKFLALSNEDLSKMGGDLIDVGFPMNFYDGPHYYNLMTGPLKKEQFPAFIKKYPDDVEQGIFVDVDYFNKDTSPNIRQKEVIEFIEHALGRSETVTELIANDWLK